jgi:broad specificity phosphatase PhoE
MMPKRSANRLEIALLALAMAALGCAPAPVYLVRHTEKHLDQGDDPDLTVAGRTRAAALVERLPRRVGAVLVTQYRRTWQTGAPVAAARSIPVIEHPAEDFDGFVSIVDAGDASALVVGHSNTLPELLRRLGVDQPPSMDEVAYGNLYVVRRSRDGSRARVRVLRFGDDPDISPH